MYPYKIITFSDGSGISFYEIFMILGVIAAIILFRVLADRLKFPAKLQNLVLIGIVASFVVGYLTAVLFQAIYDIAERGAFIIDKDTGATFYGGFIGGVICMLLIFFIGGRIFCKNFETPFRWLPSLANIAAACVPLAHGFGRIGCLFAGCCHGGETDAWYGIPMDIGKLDGVYVKVVPLQLFEAIFLFALAAFLIWHIWRRKGFAMPIYLIGYGVWRFIIEFFRTDDRGTTFLSFLSPSQLTAVVMVLLGAAIVIAYYIIIRKRGRDFFKNLTREESPSEKATASERIQNDNEQRDK